MDAASLSSTSAGSNGDLERDQTRQAMLDLRQEIQALERRIAALEQQVAPAQSEPLPVPEIEVSADTVPALGRALLALAGAYLLRALTEMAILPQAAGVASGIAYAAVWLWLAARSRTRFAAALNASTSIVIVAPLLWEAVVRLHATPPWIAAVTLAAFSLAAQALERRLSPSAISPARDLAAIVAPACAWSCIVLLFGTRALLPFALATLAIGLACEFAETPTRWMVALAADCAVSLLAGLTGRAGGLPEGYAPVPLPAAAIVAALLAVIYVGAALRRTVIQGRPFTIFGIAQTALAFVIGVGSVWYITHAQVAAACFTLAAGACCYALAWRAANRRNLYTYAAFALLLTAAATFMLSPRPALTAIWPALAVAMFFLNPGKLGNWNAAAFLWLAALCAPHSFVAVIPAAAIVYALVIRRGGERWPALFIAGAAVCSLTIALVRDVQLAAVATAILAVCSLGLAAIGTRFARRELVWLMYTTMAAAAWLLVARDLQSQTNMPMVFSLLLFGGTLVLLPRILKSARR